MNSVIIQEMQAAMLKYLTADEQRLIGQAATKFPKEFETLEFPLDNPKMGIMELLGTAKVLMSTKQTTN